MHLVRRFRILLLSEVGNVSVWAGRYYVIGLLSHWWVQFSHCIDSIPFLWYRTRFLKLGPRIGRRLHVFGPLLWLPGVALRKHFEILGGMVIYSSYQVRAIT